MTRHEFLAELHKVIKPRRYLEIGVQYGTSLNLAADAEIAIGIDPVPQCWATGNQKLHAMTSDDYFLYEAAPEDTYDFAFIDGSHRFEDALRDFINIELHSHAKTVVVFDDVLPTTTEMAAREMIPGHWTGDVWKIHRVLTLHRPELECLLVNTEPTGTMVVTGLRQSDRALPMTYPQIVEQLLDVTEVPDPILQRMWAVSPNLALGDVSQFLQHSDEVTHDRL